MRGIVAEPPRLRRMVCTCCGREMTVHTARPGGVEDVLLRLLPPKCRKYGGALREKTLLDAWKDLRSLVPWSI